jgi:hypothetical protein
MDHLATLYSEQGNSGNTVVGAPIVDGVDERKRCATHRRDTHRSRTEGERLNDSIAASSCATRMQRYAQRVPLTSLDALFPLGLGDVRLIKLDVQGCVPVLNLTPIPALPLATPP